MRRKMSKTRNVFQRKTDIPPHQPNPTTWIPISAFAPAHIIIKDLGYVDIIYQLWSKDVSISSGAFLNNKVLLWPWKWREDQTLIISLACHNYIIILIIYTSLYDSRPPRGSKYTLGKHCSVRLWPCKWDQSHRSLLALACLFDISMQIWRNSICSFKGYPTNKAMVQKIFY